jgi:hypothetical protein
MATAAQVVAIHEEYPNLTAPEIAKRLHCRSGYVRAVKKRLKLSIKPGRSGAPQIIREEEFHGG